VNDTSTYLICNTKGGVGKTIFSTMVLPFVLDPEGSLPMRVYELDDNNRTSFDRSAIEFSTFKVSDQEEIDGLAFDILTSEGVNVVDAGGGSDTLRVLEHVRTLQLPVDRYFVPLNDDIEQVDNALRTIAQIRETDPDAKITVVLNRCLVIAREEITEQFVGIFGSEDYGVDSRIEEFGQVDFAYVPNTPVFPLLKMRGTTLRDFYPVAREMNENYTEHRKRWIKDGKEAFKEAMKQYRFAVRSLALADDLLNLFEDLSQSVPRG
jgi:hypothetical protein